MDLPEKMDQLFETNNFTAEEKKFVGATTLGILAQIKVFRETESEEADLVLGETFERIIRTFSSHLSSESLGRIQNAVEYFVEELNNEYDEHRESYPSH